MRSIISCKEYERLPRSTFQRSELKILEKINHQFNSNIFKFTLNDIIPQNYIGLLKVKNKTVQILPKIADDDEEIIKNLIYMLKFTPYLKFKEFKLGNLDKAHRANFFEILINIFSNHLYSIITKNLKKNYVINQENIPFLKGKIVFTEHLKRNSIKKNMIFCQFDDFNCNIALNQIIKYTCEFLVKLSDSIQNRKILRRILDFLKEVNSNFSFSRIIKKLDLVKRKMTRLEYEYKPLINFCDLFLNSNSIYMQSIRFENFLFLVNMNKIFEDFVGGFLTVYKWNIFHKQDVEIKAQSNIGYLFDEPARFKLLPDFEIKMKDIKETILMDAKYKTLKPKERNFGITQSDMYQMFGYGIRINMNKKTLPCNKIIILFPMNSKIENYEKKIPSKFRVGKEDTSEINFHVLIRYINLNKEFKNNIERKNHFVNEFRKIFSN